MKKDQTKYSQEQVGKKFLAERRSMRRERQRVFERKKITTM